MEQDLNEWIEQKQEQYPELDKNLIKLAAKIYFKIRDDWDMAMCVSGREGCGKSTFVYWLCRLVDDDFNIKDNITYSIKDFEKKLRTLPKYAAVWPDEGSDMFYKRAWNSSERTEINKTLMMARQENKFYAFCAPRMGDTDAYLREWRIRLWVHITDRGIGYVFAYDDTVMTGDPWHLSDDKLRKKKNMIAKVSFPDMPANDKELYRKLKREYFDKHDGDGREQKGPVKITPLEIGRMTHERKKGVTLEDVANVFKKSKDTIIRNQRAYRKTLNVGRV